MNDSQTSTAIHDARATPSESQDRPGVKLLAILVGVPLVLILMLLAFLVPTLNSVADDLPLAVGGNAEATSQITGALEQTSPGMFETTHFDTAGEARDAVTNLEAIGAISVTEAGVEIVYASGAGAPYAPLLKQIGAGLEAQGQTVSYEDVAPLTEEDPSAATIATLGLPLVLGVTSPPSCSSACSRTTRACASSVAC